MEAIFELDWIFLIIAAFAGGAFGAAVGALPAFIFTGIMVIAGEAGGLQGVTGDVAFGPVFGPHISFAGGAAAAAYAAKKGYMTSGFDFHESKNIGYALGPQGDVLVVGGLFGILGLVITQFSANLSLPWDPIAIAVVLSALIHRLAFGYSLIGVVSGSGILDMSPFEREEKRSSAKGTVSDQVKSATDRLSVEPWLPHQYKWGDVAFLGAITGVLGAFIALQTGSPFLAFGISAASLLFLNLGVEKIPVTHHMTLTSSTIALAVTATEGGVLSGLGNESALIIGGAFGLICALFGELFQRVFYAHGDTHWDPPAAAIVFGTFVIALLYFVGILGTGVWVPGTV
ncbi:hypothetical protein CRI94_01715 [Longibacter salinarum]|uniref:DUF7973 domain-containing protein n=1 Tax=Longibacter salinarum TaxID=1850348 RepID=A0A2A8D2B8_9BACT|nr:hypothetical protein [Longibacter salinarum]PEN15030.1 hypothetical protein CRI94_01715 [Longibacter salinarum]